MTSVAMRRRSDPSAAAAPLSNGVSTTVSHSTVVGATSDLSLDRQDFVTLSTAISNGDDVGPFVRRAFASGRPDSLLHHLRLFSRAKESEIEELCKAHYSDFIRAVDDLRSLLCDVDDLKTSLSDTNSLLQSTGVPLLNSLDSFLYAKSLSNNLSLALNSARRCVKLLTICARANYHLGNNNLYLVLRAVDEIDQEVVKDAAAVPLPALRRMLVCYIPAIRGYAEKKISKEFSDWMVQVRAASRHLGQVAISRASAQRQRDEELNSTRSGAESLYSLDADSDPDDIAAAAASAPDAASAAGFDLTPLYRAHHIHTTLGLEDRFKKYYFENRKLQLTSDFQVSSMTPFLESHQTFLAQIAGFFIIEDRILRTGGGLVSRADVDSLWDAAVAKMVAVLEDQFSRMQTANHLLLIKDYVGLFGTTLRRYGYAVGPLMDVLAKHRDKYHDLLLADCKRQVTEALAADKFEQMMMKKEYEYSMNVLAFQIQTSDIIPAFPYVAPFSSTVPDLCRIVRSFIEDSVSFLSHGGQIEIFPTVKKYLERLLVEVIDASIVRLVDTGGLNWSQAMHVAANMAVMERACDFFYLHAALLSGVRRPGHTSSHRDFPLKRSRDASEVLLLKLLCNKIDDFVDNNADSINWMADDVVNGTGNGVELGNEYANEVYIYLDTLVETAKHILPAPVLRRVFYGVLSHVSDQVIGLFLSDSVKRFNINAVIGIDVDLRHFEEFADGLAPLFADNPDELSGGEEPRSALIEARQMVNLLMSNNPENFLNAVIRERSYNKLDYKKVVSISEKFRDSSDRLFGTFSTIGTRRGEKANPSKRKGLESLIKRLKDVS
ncbi:hypothetical protein LUZ63_019075 [Rhynchospora breviuscula]|uniref:Exocyst complex component n=1 Tax=Rhynchospora breviuscula TaxID=2022672 RepID=A0A9Q0C5J0_9POAL|nr:hypothetical protein LUZ63_019075 [Rhynchospora breviuscula]